MPSNAEHVDRAVEMVLDTGKKKIAQLGLSFKAGTDDLRESPQVQLIKRLMGEGLEVKVWDQDVSLGRLAGSIASTSKRSFRISARCSPPTSKLY